MKVLSLIKKESATGRWQDSRVTLFLMTCVSFARRARAGVPKN